MGSSALVCIRLRSQGVCLARPEVSNDAFLLQARRAHGTLQIEARNYVWDFWWQESGHSDAFHGRSVSEVLSGSSFWGEILPSISTWCLSLQPFLTVEKLAAGYSISHGWLPDQIAMHSTEQRLEKDCKTILYSLLVTLKCSLFVWQLFEKYVNSWIAVTAPFQGESCFQLIRKLLASLGQSSLYF